MKKVALLAYNGELTCFAHVMLYALDFEKKGYEVKVVIEGAATSLITELAKPDTPFAKLIASFGKNNCLPVFARPVPRRWEVWQKRKNRGWPLLVTCRDIPPLKVF